MKMTGFKDAIKMDRGRVRPRPQSSRTQHSCTRQEQQHNGIKWALTAGHLALLMSRVLAGPQLESFALDLDSGTLTLTFDEAVSSAPADVDWTGISIRTHPNGLEGWGVTLWNTEGEFGWGESTSPDTEVSLTVVIHPTDLDEMNALKVGHNSSFTWLTLRKNTFVSLGDEEGNYPVYGTQVVGHNGLAVGELTQDTTNPSLHKFSIGLAQRALVLFFSEGVAYSEADPSALSLTYIDDENGVRRNASLDCSSVTSGRDGSWREIVLQLDEPCTARAAHEDSDSHANANSSSSFNEVNGSASFALIDEGYASDWEMLGEFGMLSAEYGGSSGLGARAENIFLSATSDFVGDLSAFGNALTAFAELEISAPDCQPCGNGTYRSEPCTEVYDAVCELCTQACSGGDQFVLSPCSAETDLDCHRCTPCAFGMREISACQQSSDRVCEECTRCMEWEYESRGCIPSGDDRICETCLSCSLSAKAAKACSNSRRLLQWQMEHCCETVEGEKSPCEDVTLENLRISAREGRRHWVFEPSIPPVDGYSQLYWGRGSVARDGVVPRDDLVEVEFREGARSVFDDPRYVGQEGPTGG